MPAGAAPPFSTACYQETKDGEHRRLEKALEKISEQQLSTEWESEGDTENGYDIIIGVARTALSSDSEVSKND